MAEQMMNSPRKEQENLSAPSPAALSGGDKSNQGADDDQHDGEPKQKKFKPSLPLERITQPFEPKEHELRKNFSLTEFSELKARKSKVPTAMINKLMDQFKDENTEPGKGSVSLAMDASITPLKNGLALIQSADSFYPILDDPYMQGRLACASVLSNLYALGVWDVAGMLMNFSVSHAMTPKERDTVVPLMMKGFRDCAADAGTRVTGGETSQNPWCSIGGVASAVCSHNDYIVPDQAVAGDVLVLTKPLGTQIAVHCDHWLKTSNSHWPKKFQHLLNPKESERAYHRAIDTMTKLNVGAAKLMHKFSAHGATTIGGFGLLGHALALAWCQKNEVSFVIHNLPVITRMAGVAKTRADTFPLTQGYVCEVGGGLLICLPREKAAAFCKEIEAQYNSQAWMIGIVEEGNRTARIIDKPRIIEVPGKEKDGELW